MSAPPPAKKTAGQIEKETLKKRISNIEYRIMNVECRMSNVEVMYSVYFKKKIERSETTLRNSAVRYSLFCGSLLYLHVVSYEAYETRFNQRRLKFYTKALNDMGYNVEPLSTAEASTV